MSWREGSAKIPACVTERARLQLSLDEPPEGGSRNAGAGSQHLVLIDFRALWLYPLCHLKLPGEMAHDNQRIQRSPSPPCQQWLHRREEATESLAGTGCAGPFGRPCRYRGRALDHDGALGQATRLCLHPAALSASKSPNRSTQLPLPLPEGIAFRP